MTWPWLPPLLLVWALVGAVIAHPAFGRIWAGVRLGGRHPAGAVTAAVLWAECLLVAGMAGVVWPIPLAVHIRQAELARHGTRQEEHDRT
ncbi:hypothetical protein DQ384_36455 [Sphaerisporangium album]|uniref:Uncharacterized protein n=1 Tax=Sphaerisporangium album TaxID=509200 RepID=A0A367EUZ7_9ACTN|nr:hypothetical protein [Sphaerisporangium album]RCG21954.1 hypothetical protein DQ384_36455 [Sphaerisporangium album]